MIQEPIVLVECDRCSATITMEPLAMAGGLYSAANVPDEVVATGWIVRHEGEVVFCSYTCADEHDADAMCAADERRAEGR